MLYSGKNHLIFAQAMDKIVGQLTSAPLNETGPVYAYARYKVKYQTTVINQIWQACCVLLLYRHDNS